MTTKIRCHSLTSSPFAKVNDWKIAVLRNLIMLNAAAQFAHIVAHISIIKEKPEMPNPLCPTGLESQTWMTLYIWFPENGAIQFEKQRTHSICNFLAWCLATKSHFQRTNSWRAEGRHWILS